MTKQKMVNGMSLFEILSKRCCVLDTKARDWRRPIIVTKILPFCIFLSLYVCSSLAATVAKNPREVWLPFKRGYWANCARGTKTGHGWIFNLAEGPPVVAAADGRVLQINHPQNILVDHGEGCYGTYAINGRWEAKVIPGQLIAAGTELADIETRGNRKGRGVPLLNFSMRGPTHKQTHDLRFRLAGSKKGVEINKKTKYLSGTRKGHASKGNFKESTLQGNEFKKQGVHISSSNPMYWLPSGKETIYEGKTLQDADMVVFQLWTKNEAGKMKLVCEAKSTPDADGRFKLSVIIPDTVYGPCVYRLGARKGKGGIPGGFRLPAAVGPSGM